MLGQGELTGAVLRAIAFVESASLATIAGVLAYGCAVLAFGASSPLPILAAMFVTVVASGILTTGGAQVKAIGATSVPAPRAEWKIAAERFIRSMEAVVVQHRAHR